MKKEYMPFPVDGKIILFTSVERNDRILFLYGADVSREYAYLSFMNNGLENGELCLYAYPKDKDRAKITPSSVFGEYLKKKQLVLLDVEEGLIKGEDEAKYVKDCVKRIEDKIKEAASAIDGGAQKSGRFLIDYGNMSSSEYLEGILKLEKKYIGDKKLPVSWISAFNVASLNYEAAGALVKQYQKVFFSNKFESTVAIPGFYGMKGGEAQEGAQTQSGGPQNNIDKNTAQPSGTISGMPVRSQAASGMIQPDVVSQKTLEQFVKSSLDTVILSIIYKKPMSGFQIIKTIERYYHVPLSHGTIYPLLHGLEKDGVVKTELGDDMKSKIYKATEQGAKIIESKVKELRSTHAHLVELIDGGSIE